MKKYIQPRNYVVNIVMESLIATSAGSTTTQDYGTNKKNQEERTTHPIWGD